MTADEWDTTDRFRDMCVRLTPRPGAGQPVQTLGGRLRRLFAGRPVPPPPGMTERQRRLLIAGCFRHLWDIGPSPSLDCTRAVELVERMADDTLTAADRDQLARIERDQGRIAYVVQPEGLVRTAAKCFAAGEPFCYAHFGDMVPMFQWLIPEVSVNGGGLLRCVVGNPLRPVVAFDPRWRTSTAVGLARGMYDTGEFGATPILADALQDAGCEDASILQHCRAELHTRGCWVVDAVFGKG